MKRKPYKPAYSVNKEPTVISWGNSLDPRDKGSIKTHIASYQEDLEANDKLPEKLRKIVNDTPNIKWSSVKILQALNNSKQMWPFLTEEELMTSYVKLYN